MAKARKMNRGITNNINNHPDNSPKIVTISLGHIINNRIQMSSYCGKQCSGWFYGTVGDVRCSNCSELYLLEQAEKESSKKK